MLGIDAKRGVEATLERVYNNTGNRFGKLSFAWVGKTAGICRDGDTTKILFPSIDETKEIDRSLFNELIGYALHELGHAWFTNDKPWNDARDLHGAFVSNLINGLEDPRIEQRVIDSGYALNSRSLFENLLNAVLLKDGYVDGNDFKNIPFVLAVEGRRLNGYHVAMPSVLGDAPWGNDLRWALKESHRAKTTEQVVAIAIELYRRLKQEEEDGEGGEGKDSGEKDVGDDGTTQGNPTDAGQDGDQGGDQGDRGEEQDGQQSDKPDYGSGKSEVGGRDVEPTSHINDRCDEVRADFDNSKPRPNPIKPRVRQVVFID